MLWVQMGCLVNVGRLVKTKLENGAGRQLAELHMKNQVPPMASSDTAEHYAKKSPDNVINARNKAHPFVL